MCNNLFEEQLDNNVCLLYVNNKNKIISKGDIEMNDNIISIEEKERAIKNITIALSDTYSIGISNERLYEICKSLNILFPEFTCEKVIYTVNMDKLPFGIVIDPRISNSDLMNILFEQDQGYKLDGYQIEIDSKLFMDGLSAEDVTKMILHDVELMSSVDIITKLRGLIDVYVTNTIDNISVRDAVNANSILIYAIKDTLNKLSSCLYNKYDFDYTEDEMISRISKLDYKSISMYDSFPKVIILQWAFMIYKDLKTNYNLVKDTLEEAKELTGSKLIQNSILNTLQSISRIGITINESVSLDKFIDQKNIPLNEISIFKSLKTSGLRAIENDYYEYAMLVKTASDEAEALYALRGINTRINILSDYIFNTKNLSDAERNHWQDVINMYQELRIKLTKKNIINKKSYGLWFDYSKLDNMDKDTEEDY